MPFGSFQLTGDYSLSTIREAMGHYCGNPAHTAYAAFTNLLMEKQSLRFVAWGASSLMEPGEHTLDEAHTANEIRADSALLKALMYGYKRASITEADVEKAMAHYRSHSRSRLYFPFSQRLIEARAFREVGDEITVHDLLTRTDLLYPLMDGYERALERDAQKRKRHR